MGKDGLFGYLRKSLGRRPIRADRRRQFKPAGEALEARQVLAPATVISAVQQYGIPSVFAVGSTGNVSYNFLVQQNGNVTWNGWTQVPGGVGATTIATGTVLPRNSSIVRPYVFLINTAQNVYYNSMNSAGAFNGWTPVGMNVGAVSMTTGTIPIVDSPYIVMINGNDDVYYNSQTSNGGWSGWVPLGVGVGAVSVATGVIQTSRAPAIYEPYVVMMNTARNVYYKARSSNGTWSNWTPVGINVGAAAISATTISNMPNVSMLNTAGNVYINEQSTSGAWFGWLPAGAGTGSGATPAFASQAIVSSFNNYEFAINDFGQVYSAFGIYGHWSTWFPLGNLPAGVASFTMTATSPPSSVPFAFTIGTDGNVYWADQTAWAQWSSFASLGAPM